MSLVLHRSNRIEELSKELAALLKQSANSSDADFSAEDLLRPETVVINSMGMQRWLSMQLAHHLGISSNINFPFPTRTIQDILHTTAGGTDSNDLQQWGPKNLAWHILTKVRESLEIPAFAPLKGYLCKDDQAPTTVARTQYILARRIADVFDKYLTYRPEMVLEWETSPHQYQDDWQPLLWNQLRTKLQGPHVANLAAEFLSRPVGRPLDTKNLPSRLMLFGLSTFPPLWVDVLNKLSEHIPVHLFLLCPSRNYWGYISSKREIAIELRKQSSQDILASELYLEEGNPLLSSFGRVGRDFQCVLEGPTALEGYQDSGDELFIEPDDERPTMLTLLQRDILDLRSPKKEAPENDERFPPAHVIASTDNSVQFHSCHGALRQVEVLRDRLLALLNDDATLDPRDIIVLTTDIEKYAPLISAVFSEGDSLENGRITENAPNGFPCLPFSIADRSLEKLNPVAESLVKVLELAGGRVPSTQVMELLNYAPVRNKFEIDFSDIPRLRQWVADGSIRWGIDSGHKERQGHPNTRPSTFEFGLDRMILGYVFEGEAIYGDAVSAPSVGENEATLLGHFTTFCRTLFTTLEVLQVPKNTADWCQTLRQAVQDLTQTESNDEWLTHQVLLGIDSLDQAAQGSDNEAPLELDALQAALSEHFQGTPEFTSFLSGGITCCAMVPMRSVPFRVVCFLGMDDNEFPRQPTTLGFDFTAQSPRLGDRNPRDDDRYLFLESLLSARDNIIICYTGRGIRDNKPYPAAVPISELQDCIEQSFVPADAPKESLLSRIVHEHPLQGFSPSAFQGSSISFHRPYLAGAKHLLEPKHQAPAFMSSPLSATPADETAPIALDDLSRFLKNPSATFLQQCLGLSYFNLDSPLDDGTPLDLIGLDRWMVGDQVCRLETSGLSAEDTSAMLHGTGQIPAGTMGTIAMEKVYSQATPLARAAKPLFTGDPGWADIQLELSPTTTLYGRITQLFDERRVSLQYGKIKGAHLLDHWLMHLALQAHPQSFGPTVLLARNNDSKEHPASFQFAPLSDDKTEARTQAMTHLQTLYELYRQAHQFPLPLFPQASWAYAKETLTNPEDPKLQAKGRKAAESKWYRENFFLGFAEGDATDPAVNRIYEGYSPYAGDFEHPALSPDTALSFDQLALTVWGPLLRHLSVENLA